MFVLTCNVMNQSTILFWDYRFPEGLRCVEPHIPPYIFHRPPTCTETTATTKINNQTSARFFLLNPWIDCLVFFRTKKLSPSDRSVWCPRPYTIFKLLLSARFCSAFLSNISDCDETFNYWEPVSKAILKTCGSVHVIG